MVYFSGKAIEGGTPLSEDEIERLAQQHLADLQQTFETKAERAKTADILSRRLGEELRLVQRMLEIVERELEKKGERDAAGYIRHQEESIEDIAEIVEADEPCEAIEDIDEDIRRRLLRSSLDGEDAPCRRHRPSILRKRG